jgi:hypothetical protein
VPLRVATVTAYTDNLSRRLATPRLRRVRQAEELRAAALQFAAEALPDDPLRRTREPTSDATA